MGEGTGSSPSPGVYAYNSLTLVAIRESELRLFESSENTWAYRGTTGTTGWVEARDAAKEGLQGYGELGGNDGCRRGE